MCFLFKFLIFYHLLCSISAEQFQIIILIIDMYECRKYSLETMVWFENLRPLFYLVTIQFATNKDSILASKWDNKDIALLDKDNGMMSIYILIYITIL